MSKLLRGAVGAALLAGGAVGLLAMSSSNVAAFQSCPGTYNCFQPKDCDAGCQCQGAAFPVAGHCKVVAQD